MSEFVCDLEPRGDGGWDIWVSEVPYRGVRTDAVLGQVGERKRIGGTWTSRYLVGREGSEGSARETAGRAITECVRLARVEEAEAMAWRQNASREPIHMTAPHPTTTERPAAEAVGESE